MLRVRSTRQGKPNYDLCLSPQPPCSQSSRAQTRSPVWRTCSLADVIRSYSDQRRPMKKSSYLNPSASFDAALNDLVSQCRVDRFDIEDARARMNQRLHQAAAVHGIDPSAVRRFARLYWSRGTTATTTSTPRVRRRSTPATEPSSTAGCASCALARGHRARQGHVADHQRQAAQDR